MINEFLPRIKINKDYKAYECAGDLKFTAYITNALVSQNYTQLSANSILFIAFIKPINLFYQIIYLFIFFFTGTLYFQLQELAETIL